MTSPARVRWAERRPPSVLRVAEPMASGVAGSRSRHLGVAERWRLRRAISATCALERENPPRGSKAEPGPPPLTAADLYVVLPALFRGDAEVGQRRHDPPRKA